MRLLIQRSPDPVPYRGAYFRISADAGHPTRGSVVLAPEDAFGEDVEGLSLLLGLVLVLGEPATGGAPIRQQWLSEALELEGKLGSEISRHHAAEVRRLAGRIRGGWNLFLANAFARLHGEERGSAHFRYPEGTWISGNPTVVVAAWPPLPGETLPTLE